MNKNELLIKEKCVFSYMRKDSSGIKLLALDSNFKPIGYLSSREYSYENKTVTTKFRIPKGTYQVVYFNGRSKPLDSYFYGGVNLVNFDKNNIFEITNCGMTNDMPVKFLNPFIQFEIKKDGSLTVSYTHLTLPTTSRV